ncbi:MAG: lysis protein [Acidobacteriota bacterium]|nr:lysis protein [Acidobacteriota bacterium]
MEPANVLKIESLPNGWRDKDDIIFHACFQLLKDFVEQEKEIIKQIDWKHTEEIKNAKEEIDFLYNWWLERVKEEDSLEEKQYLEDNRMLIMLIEIRKHLWS